MGETLTITRGHERITVVIDRLGERRGPAAEAQQLYVETPESVARRERELERAIPAARTGGRPTKRDRRRLDRDRGRRGY